jgi:uracil DNA glycosylase
MTRSCEFVFVAFFVPLHPSPECKPGKWFGNKHFSKTNSYLKANGEKEIDWILITVVFF